MCYVQKYYFIWIFEAWEVLISSVLRPVYLIMWSHSEPSFTPLSMIQRSFWSFLVFVQGILKIKFNFSFMNFAPKIIPAWGKKKILIGWGFFTLYKLEEAWKLWSFTRKLQNSCNHVITTVNEMETTKYSNWFVMQNKCFLLFSQT